MAEVEEFSSGAKREVKSHKSRPDLISPYFMERLGFVLAKGAIEHDERNWEKGLPDESAEGSLYRHWLGYQMSKSKGCTSTIGKSTDDHLGQLAFNLMVLIHNEEIRKLNL